MPPLRNIHTHPTSLTAICPVINLTDTLCNIDCLIALHRIAACLFLHVCACVCVSASVFALLSTCLSFCSPVHLLVSASLALMLMNVSVPDAWHCVRARCSDVIWCRDEKSVQLGLCMPCNFTQLLLFTFICHLEQAGPAQRWWGEGGLQIEDDNNYWEREWEADSDVWLRATKVWSCNIGFYLTVAHWCFILSEGGNASSLYPALFLNLWCIYAIWISVCMHDLVMKELPCSLKMHSSAAFLI